MTKEKNHKQKQIEEIVSVVKLASLFLVGIILYNDVLGVQQHNILTLESYYAMIAFFIPLIVLVSIYFVWSFIMKNKIKNKYSNILNIIEACLFMILFVGIILLSGSHESKYKFVFLFIIITTTIQSGMKQGLIVAIISSCTILSIDILSAPNMIVNNYFESDLILAGIFILTAWPLGFYVKIESEHIKKLENIANVDGLTELYNHRYFHEILRKSISDVNKNGGFVSLIFIDIDYFKHYNDLYGHQKGDYVLKKVGEVIKGCIRTNDIVARYGGEEFAVILPNTNEATAVLIAEKIRNNIEETYFEGEENQPNGKITSSIGVSIYPEKSNSDIELIKNADDALYRAKFFKKNRVETYTSILDDIKENIDEKDLELVTSIKTLISVINAKDRYTYGHVERVVIYSRIIAEGLGLDIEDKNNLVYGAYLHDIGKINISKEILNKKGKLTDEEWNELKQHPENGVEIIKPVKSLEKVIPLILHHHERYDGKGYPYNLKGEEIPYLSRILTIADSFDAMTSSRPYNIRKSYDEALEELKRCKGLQFDPELVDKFIEILSTHSDNALINDIRAIK